MSQTINLKNINKYSSSNDKLYTWIEELGLIKYTNQQCPTCPPGTMMRVYNDIHLSDGEFLQCHECKKRLSIRHGSIFEHSHLSIQQSLQILSCFIAMTTVTQASQLTGVSRHHITDHYKKYRILIEEWLTAHPPHFKVDDIIEIDESNIKALNKIVYDEEIEKDIKELGWVIGGVGRKSKVRVVEIMPHHDGEAVHNFVYKYVNKGATVLVDKWPAYLQLMHDYLLHQGEKFNVVIIDPILTYDENELLVHTNTIEGTWSHLKNKLHSSYGYRSDYLHLVLSEFNFRSLQIDILVPLKAV